MGYCFDITYFSRNKFYKIQVKIFFKLIIRWIFVLYFIYKYKLYYIFFSDINFILNIINKF